MTNQFISEEEYVFSKHSKVKRALSRTIALVAWKKELCMFARIKPEHPTALLNNAQMTKNQNIVRHEFHKLTRKIRENLWNSCLDFWFQFKC